MLVASVADTLAYVDVSAAVDAVALVNPVVQVLYPDPPLPVSQDLQADFRDEERGQSSEDKKDERDDWAELLRDAAIPPEAQVLRYPLVCTSMLLDSELDRKVDNDDRTLSSATTDPVSDSELEMKALRNP